MPSVKALVQSSREGHTATLDLSAQGIKELSEELCALEALEELVLSHNKIDEIPESISGLRSLKYLNLFNNQVKSVAPQLADLRELRFLVLANNALKELPAGFGSAAALTMLDLSCNSLRELRANFGYLTTLRILHLADNKLQYLPAEIANLTNLETLNIRDNRLEALPPTIGQLKQVKCLFAQGNKLQWLPPELAECTVLMRESSQLKLYGNPLNANLVKRYVEEGIGGLRSYITSSDYVMKIVAIRETLPAHQRASEKQNEAVMQKRRTPRDERASGIASFAGTALDNLPDHGHASLYSANTLGNGKRDSYVGAFSAAASTNWRLSMQQSETAAAAAGSDSKRHSVASDGASTGPDPRTFTLGGRSSRVLSSVYGPGAETTQLPQERGSGSPTGLSPERGSRSEMGSSGIFDFYLGASNSREGSETGSNGDRRSASPKRAE